MAQREHWGSRIGFILAAAGSSIGLGNIWKFPYLTGQNGGAAFVLIYLLCVLIMGLPIMIAEVVIGRHTEKDPVGAFKAMMGGTAWQFVGYIGVSAGFLILSYYSVVGGWTAAYLFKSLNGTISSIGNVDQAKTIFSQFVADPWQMVLCHGIFTATCVLVVIGGIRNGIERWSKILMPVLFVILLTLIVKGLFMKGSSEGLSFYLKPDFSRITGGTVLAALGQSFFSLSLGMGAMITYGSYLSKNDKILNASLWIVCLDTGAALLAGLAIFPSLFAMGMSPEEGPGLIFHVLPVVFSGMTFGGLFSFLFFLLLFIAALTSGISLLQVVVAYITDEKGWSRNRAVTVFGFFIFLFGIPSALSFNAMSGFNVLPGVNFFDFIDRLTSNYMLPIGGFLIAVALGWKYGLDRTMHELDPDTRFFYLKETWAVTIKFVSPVAVAICFFFFIRNDVMKLIDMLLG